jgi:hypothetical protein
MEVNEIAFRNNKIYKINLTKKIKNLIFNINNMK